MQKKVTKKKKRDKSKPKKSSKSKPRKASKGDKKKEKRGRSKSKSKSKDRKKGRSKSKSKKKPSSKKSSKKGKKPKSSKKSKAGAGEPENNLNEFIGSEYKDNLRFTILMVGDGGVGKTSIIQNYIGLEFQEDYNPTILVDFQTKKKENKYNFTTVSTSKFYYSFFSSLFLNFTTNMKQKNVKIPYFSSPQNFSQFL